MLIKALLTEHLHHEGKTAKYPVADSMRLVKGRSARFCNLELHRDGGFWHHESYDHYARDEAEATRILHYIINNPAKAGLVKNWKDWKYTYVSPELGEW
jgi:REP element-mobilizing transposase RayT